MTNEAIAAFAAAQSNMPDLQKNAINPHFGNRYVSLESLMPKVLEVLEVHGFVLLQVPSTVDGQPALTTELIYTDGSTFGGTTPLVLDKQTPQAHGSAITYMKRYALMSILGLVADKDDDGESAMDRGKKSKVAETADAYRGEALAHMDPQDRIAAEYLP